MPNRKTDTNHLDFVGASYGYPEGDYAERERIDTIGGGARMSDEMFETYRKVGGLPQLDGLYTVFGEVTMGMDVVEKMLDAETDDYDRPLYDIMIISARVEE